MSVELAPGTNFQHNIDFTVLMAVYGKDDPTLFERALNSVFANTLLPKNVLVVLDGPLTDELEAVLSNFQSKQSCLDVVRLKNNVGLARALNEGLKEVKTEWIARADADDFNYETRFESQAKEILKLGNNVDILGCSIREVNPDFSPIAVRTTVSGNEAIRKFAARRNPFNHMTVWYRTSKVLDVGGYPDIHLKEDYALWASLMDNGARCENLAEVLVDAVAGEAMYERRGGLKYAIAELQLQLHLRDSAIKGLPQAITDGIMRAAVFLMPASLRSAIYKRLLRDTLSNN